MKKLSILFLIISSLAINLPFAQAQRRNLKPAAATPATQRSVDQITAAQMRADAWNGYERRRAERRR